MRGRIDGAFDLVEAAVRDASAARLFSWWLRDEINAIRFPDEVRRDDVNRLMNRVLKRAGSNIRV